MYHKAIHNHKDTQQKRISKAAPSEKSKQIGRNCEIMTIFAVVHRQKPTHRW